MFGKLKEKAMGAAKEKVTVKVQEIAGPGIQQHIDTFKNLKVSDVSDDSKYNTVLVTPVWASIKAQIGPVEGLAKKAGIDLQDRLTKGLFNVRDELIVVEGESVKLHQDFNAKLVPTIMNAFKN
ncbi:hypothetical protein LO80_00485 [Candidatus Francisella endociliophora]|uniref:Uncharacterized protein n=1 Tax=Candidatus Francisella endociliophora TaxID=653937 RepID=A0A097EM27_9GAMM|nr:hypothetical protein [Francisella sp. FSC1006]AIT08598.1 hypothetical protein LO80_00485 [Francisella sp. FSC1006]